MRIVLCIALAGLMWALASDPRPPRKEEQAVNARTTEDREAIVGHIRRIFDAYIARDRDALRRLHTHDWIGFQGPSTSIERGIDAYMKNADRSLEHFHGAGYELLDTEVQIHGDIGIVYYVARYDYRNPDGTSGSIPLRSVDIYRREKDGWNQCGSHIGVIPTEGAWGEGARK